MRSKVDRTIDINWLWANQFLPKRDAGRYHRDDIAVRQELVAALGVAVAKHNAEYHQGTIAAAARATRLRQIHKAEIWELAALEHAEACQAAGIRGARLMEASHERSR